MHRRSSAKQSLAALNAEFISLTSANVDWEETWRWMIGHKWFQLQLRIIAAAILKNAKLPANLIDDVIHEAIVDIANSLQRDAGLRYDPDKGTPREFLLAIARRSCRKSLRQFRWKLPPFVLLDTAEKSWAIEQQFLEIRQSIDDMPEPTATIARLFCAGMNVGDIAKQMNRSRRSIYRNVQKAKKFLRNDFQDETGEK